MLDWGSTCITGFEIEFSLPSGGSRTGLLRGLQRGRGEKAKVTNRDVTNAIKQYKTKFQPYSTVQRTENVTLTDRTLALCRPCSVCIIASNVNVYVTVLIMHSYMANSLQSLCFRSFTTKLINFVWYPFSET